MKKNLITAVLYTIATTLLLGVVYPLVITGLAQLFFKDKANGQLIQKSGEGAGPQTIMGSRLIAQPFTGAQYFHPRPSAAGTNGYDASNSSGSNLGPTNQKLVDRVKTDVTTLQSEKRDLPIPIDMVTTSGSGLDPHITPAAAQFQIARVATARNMDVMTLAALVAEHTEQRQFGILGEPRVNVMELNLAIDEKYPIKK
ncbi:MAG TPA: potassium-transporting ATPase subunit KdpC [Candidatus Angelobacter sp.]|jgi:K+-transporting ATPase ATPase C chain|nr:potassium-transporting ATPase subunit KdpC [Candidatus Angelobacter sp.]